MAIARVGMGIGLVALAALGACVGVIGGEGEGASSSGSQLRNAGDGLGCDTLAAEDLYAIGLLKNGCVATLIGPNTIVTAAHCIAPNESMGDYGATPSDGLHWMLNPESSVLPGSPSYIVHRPEHCAPEEEYRVVRFVSFGMGLSDVAIAQIFPRDVSGVATYPQVTPFALEASDPPRQASTQIDLYGRGCTTFGDDYDGQLRRVRLPYTAEGSWVYDFNQRSFAVPELAAVLAPHFPPHGDGMSSDELMTFFENVGNTCWGDSGSPAIVAGTRGIVKLVSGGGAAYDYWEPGAAPRLNENFASIALVHSLLVGAGVNDGIFGIQSRLASGAVPGNLEALAALLESVQASGAFGSSTDGGPIGADDYSPNDCCQPGVNNFCLIGVAVEGCWMTGPGGYCDPNGDSSFDDADWIRGYDEYQAQCGSSSASTPPPPPPPPAEPGAGSCCAAGANNFCLIGVDVSGCPMTQPGGYCDPNGDGSFDDADWIRGYDEYQAACP